MNGSIQSVDTSSIPVRITMCIESYTQIKVSETFVEQIKKQIKDCHVTITTCNPDTDFSDVLREVTENLDIEFIPLSDSNLKENFAFSRKADVFISRVLGKLSLVSAHFKVLLRERNSVCYVFNNVHTDIAIVLEDGIAGPASFIAEARQRKIPVVVLPYEISQRRDLENAMRIKATNGEIYEIPSGLKGVLLRKFAKHWMCPFLGIDGFMFSPDYILARIIAGVDVPDPWVTHGGYADLIAVESMRANEIYEHDGIPAGKRDILGSPYLEAIASVLESDTQARAAYTQGKLIQDQCIKVMVSLPPSYGSIGDDEIPFIDYMRSLIECLNTVDFHKSMHINLFLHPAMLTEDRKAIENLDLVTSANVQICDEWIIPEMARHDIVISFFSSTIRWALAVGKPVINLDPYNWNLDLYDDDPGFTRAFSLEHLTEIITDFCVEANMEKKLHSLKETRAAWGVVKLGYSKKIVDKAKNICTNG